jgi:hypothetical protein
VHSHPVRRSILSVVHYPIELSLRGPSISKAHQKQQFPIQTTRRWSRRKFNLLGGSLGRIGVHGCLHPARRSEAEDTLPPAASFDLYLVGDAAEKKRQSMQVDGVEKEILRLCARPSSLLSDGPQISILSAISSLA